MEVVRKLIQIHTKIKKSYTVDTHTDPEIFIRTIAKDSPYNMLNKMHVPYE
jgi:hypothetical protein